MNYQLFSPVFGLLRLLFAALLLCSLGLWIELLWFSATHGGDPFWHFSEERVAFAVGGTALACALCWLFQRRAQPPLHNASQRNGSVIFAIAALVGAISGLGLWELVRMLFVHSEAADLLRAWQHHSIFY